MDRKTRVFASMDPANPGHVTLVKLHPGGLVEQIHTSVWDPNLYFERTPPVPPETVNQSAPAPRYPWTLEEASTRYRVALAHAETAKAAADLAREAWTAACSARDAAREAAYEAQEILVTVAGQE